MRIARVHLEDCARTGIHACTFRLIEVTRGFDINAHVHNLIGVIIATCTMMFKPRAVADQVHLGIQ